MQDLGFTALTIVMILIFVMIIYKYVHDAQDRKKTFIGFTIFLVIWVSYNQSLIHFGLILSTDMPPRIPILVFLPLFLIMAFSRNTVGIKAIIAHMPMALPIAIQAFRVIVELLIFESYKNGILPERVTFSGYNFDIIIGALALPAAYLTYKASNKRRSLIVWNVFGLSILVVTVSSFVYSFYFASENQIDLNFIQYPLVFLPTVLLPFAIFFHVISLSQLKGIEQKVI
jgi:hypothetical protein